MKISGVFRNLKRGSKYISGYVFKGVQILAHFFTLKIITHFFHLQRGRGRRKEI